MQLQNIYFVGHVGVNRLLKLIDMCRLVHSRVFLPVIINLSSIFSVKLRIKTDGKQFETNDPLSQPEFNVDQPINEQTTGLDNEDEPMEVYLNVIILFNIDRMIVNTYYLWILSNK